MRLLSVTLLLVGLLLLIFYKRGRTSVAVQAPVADPLPFSGSEVIKQVKAVDSVSRREQQLQKARENREENLLDDFDYLPAEEWNREESQISNDDKEAIGLFMEQLFPPVETEESAAEDQLLAGGAYIDEQWIDRLNRGEMEEIRGTEVALKQKQNIEEAIASGRYNETVAQLFIF